MPSPCPRIGGQQRYVFRAADNTQLGVAERRYLTNISKTCELGSGLDRVTDAHVRMSLKLQAAFGFRRKESLLFQTRYADRGDRLVQKGSWTKGGWERTVLITTPEAPGLIARMNTPSSSDRL